MHLQKYQSGVLGNMLKHYRRDNIPENADVERTGQNWNAVENNGGIDFINSRISELDLKRAPRKDAVKMIDIVLTLPKEVPVENEKDFFKAAANFFSEKFGRANVISAWVHEDETTPHMHFAFVPITEDGRLSAKDIVSRQMLKSLHEETEKAIEKELGFHVALTLDETEQGEKQLSRLNQKEYIAAKKRLESLRQETKSLSETTPESLPDALRAPAEVRRLSERAEQLERENESLREHLRKFIRDLRERIEIALGRIEQSRPEPQREFIDFQEQKALALELAKSQPSMSVSGERWSSVHEKHDLTR